jgi:hypothetical protein
MTVNEILLVEKSCYLYCAVKGHQSLPYMCIANSGFAILLVTTSHEMFIWEADDVEFLLTSKSADLPGCWSNVDVNKAALPLPGGCPELAVNAVFALTNSVRI